MNKKKAASVPIAPQGAPLLLNADQYIDGAVVPCAGGRGKGW